VCLSLLSLSPPLFLSPSPSPSPSLSIRQAACLYLAPLFICFIPYYVHDRQPAAVR
jgi:hypothetical protein